MAACAWRSARRVCGTWAALCIVETRAWALGVEEHVQRSGGAVIVAYWQRSGSVVPAQGSAKVCALRAQCDFSLGLRCRMGTLWLRHCFECAECGVKKHSYLDT